MICLLPTCAAVLLLCSAGKGQFLRRQLWDLLFLDLAILWFNCKYLYSHKVNVNNTTKVLECVMLVIVGTDREVSTCLRVYVSTYQNCFVAFARYEANRHHTTDIWEKIPNKSSLWSDFQWDSVRTLAAMVWRGIVFTPPAQ